MVRYPSPSLKPGWYCEFWTDKETQEANRIAQVKETLGWSHNCPVLFSRCQENPTGY